MTNHEKSLNDMTQEWPYSVKYDKENELSADVLVIGGGLAGCHAAIRLA
jgi:heterodisulfide reductase subunit A-like polyferredoxin